MHRAGLDPATAAALVTPIAGVLLKLGSQAMQPWLERHREEQRRRALLGTPMEQLVRTLESRGNEQEKQLERVWAELDRRDKEHQGDMETAREATEALRQEHEKCQKDLQAVQRQLGDQARQIENLERAAGVKP